MDSQSTAGDRKKVSVSALQGRLGRASARGIALDVGRLIVGGDLPPRAQLPTVRALADALHVGPTTVAAAWSLLKQERLIHTAGRNGTYVSNRAPTRTMTSSDDRVLDVLAYGADDRVRVSVSGLEEQLAQSSAQGIALDMARLIDSGELLPGIRLPTVRALADAMHVGPTTVAAAWSILKQERLIHTAGRNGTHVRHRLHSTSWDVTAALS